MWCSVSSSFQQALHSDSIPFDFTLDYENLIHAVVPFLRWNLRGAEYD